MATAVWRPSFSGGESHPAVTTNGGPCSVAPQPPVERLICDAIIDCVRALEWHELHRVTRVLEMRDDRIARVLERKHGILLTVTNEDGWFAEWRCREVVAR